MGIGLIVTNKIQKLVSDNHESVLITQSNYTEWKRNQRLTHRTGSSNR